MKPLPAVSAPVQLVTAVALSVALIAGLAWAFGGNEGGVPAAPKPTWLLLSSSRDGSSGEFDLSGGLRAYAMRPDGSRLTRLLAKGRKLNPLAVSADRSTIAYGVGEYAPETIFVSKADGTGLQRVAHFADAQGGAQAVALSPDGSELALQTEDPNENPRVFVVGADGHDRRDLGRAADPDWSPDGKKLVLATGRGCVILAEPFDRDPIVHIRGKCRVPRWSPDGKELVFETKGGCGVVPSSSPPDLLSRLNQQVFGGGGRLLGRKCATPGWSPDGRWIAFETKEGLWVTRPNGEGRRRLGPAHDVTDVPFAWSPDSSRIALGGLVMTVAGRTIRVAYGASSESAPVWSANGSRLALVRKAGDDPAQIWGVRAEGGGLKRLTNAGQTSSWGSSGRRRSAGPWVR
jgi:Tol biopolymer transport system component